MLPWLGSRSPGADEPPAGGFSEKRRAKTSVRVTGEETRGICGRPTAARSIRAEDKSHMQFDWIPPAAQRGGKVHVGSTHRLSDLTGPF